MFVVAQFTYSASLLHVHGLWVVSVCVCVCVCVCYSINYHLVMQSRNRDTPLDVNSKELESTLFNKVGIIYYAQWHMLGSTLDTAAIAQ